jgi:ferredoxin-NADP reductase
MSVTAGRAEDFDAAGHLSRSVFDKVGIPREADVYLCGPIRFMADMKEALGMLGVAPERIHVELFNGSESLTPGVVGTATRTPHAPEHDADTGALVSFARSAGSPLERDSLNLFELAGPRCPGPLVLPDRCLSQL